MYLDTVDRTVELVLAVPITTNPLDVVSAYAEVDAPGNVYVLHPALAHSNDTTPVTILPSPAADRQHAMKYLGVRNADTVAATVIIAYNDNGTLFGIYSVDLDPGDLLVFTDAGGWEVLTSTGALKGSGGGGGGAPSGPAGGDLAGTYPNPSVAQAAGAFALKGIIMPTALSGQTDDWNPSGLAGAATILAETSGSQNLTGLAGGADGRIIILVNYGSDPLVLKSLDSASSAANRFILSGDQTLQAGDVIVLSYVSDSALWFPVAAYPTRTVQVLDASPSGTGNSGSGETDLFTTDVPANTLLGPGDRLVFESGGEFGVSLDSDRRLRIYWGDPGGPTQIFDSGGLAILSGGSWWVRGTIMYDTSTSQKINIQFGTSDSGVLGFITSFSTAGEDTGTDLVVKATGDGSTLNDIVGELWSVDKFRKA